MPMHFIARFEPLAGRDDEFREALLRVAEASRTEEGCLGMKIFESVRAPVTFAIHSEWTDEAAFNRHAEFPHTKRFLEAAESLLSHAVHGQRLRALDAE
jgi:quinol monooxygenase YgiN